MQILITEQSTVEELSKAVEENFDCYYELLGHSLELEEQFLAREIPQDELYQMVTEWIISGDECKI